MGIIRKILWKLPGIAFLLFVAHSIPSWAVEYLPSAEIHVEGFHDVIVVGAGVSGLTTGYFLKEYDVKILERNNHTGGNTLSGSFEGIPYSIGSGSIDEPNTIFQRLVDELHLPLEKIPSPRNAYYYKGKMYYGPEGLALAAIAECGVEEYNRFITAIVTAYRIGYPSDSPLRDLDEFTAKEWFDREKFAPCFYSIYEAKARQIFGVGLNELSARGLVITLGEDVSEARPVTDASQLTNDPNQVNERVPAYSFMNGLAEYTNAITHVLGDKIQLNSNVLSVARNGNRYLVTYSDLEGKSHALKSKAVVFATPASIVVRLAPDVLSEEQKTLLNTIPYSSYFYVMLFSREPLYGKAFDLRIAKESVFCDLFDSTWMRRHALQTIQEENVYINGLLITPMSYQDQTLINLTEDQLMEKVYTELETVIPGATSKITGRQIYRFSKSAPVMTVGASKRLERLRNSCTGSFSLAGSYVMTPTFQSTVNSGYLAAQQAIDTLANSSSVDYFDRYERESERE